MNTNLTHPHPLEPGSIAEPRDYQTRSLGPKYAPHDSNAPMFEGIDIAAFVAAVVITLGPLAAYSLGLGA